MRTSSTLVAGQRDLGALVVAVCDAMDKDVGRVARAHALVAVLRFGVGVEHAAIDVREVTGVWNRLAATPGTTPADPLRLELRTGGRKVGRVEVDGRAMRRRQRESVQAILPLLARGMALAAHEHGPIVPAPLPTMAVEHAVARFDLTPREADILGYLARGQSNKNIAKQAGCTEGTLEHHVRALMRKAGVESRSELIALVWSRLAR